MRCVLPPVIIVDALAKRGAPWKGGLSCHLGSDSDPNELLAFADRLKFPRSWIHWRPGDRPHMDLAPFYRRLAVRAGAVEVDSKEFVRRVPRCGGTALSVERGGAIAG